MNGHHDTASVSVAFNTNQTRAAFRLTHAPGNIITRELVATLRSGLENVSQNPHLKLVTFEGDGPDFSFGTSIPEHAPDQIHDALVDVHALIVDLLDMPAVTAAVVRGRCLGGGFELALACDLIFAADNATFGLPEISLGVFPPAGSVLLPLRVGTARSTHAILTGQTQPASVWHDAGLIALVAPVTQLDAEVDRWFDRHLASKSAAALRHAAAAARTILADGVREALPKLERLYLDDLMQTHDAVEGSTPSSRSAQPSGAIDDR